MRLEHSDVPAISINGKQFHHLLNQLLQVYSRPAAIRQAATHLELHHSSRIWRQTWRPRHSSAARQPALPLHQRANNIGV